jgi:HSP20 family molecular chaperone IbpA
MRKLGERTVMEIDLHGIENDEIEVLSTGSELHLQVRDVGRRISLPASVAGRTVASSHLSDGVLHVVFSD